MVALECPFCNQTIEAKPPDKVHSAYSFERPIATSYYGKLIEKELTCPNPKCRELVTVYCYAPMDYSNRV